MAEPATSAKPQYSVNYETGEAYRKDGTGGWKRVPSARTAGGGIILKDETGTWKPVPNRDGSISDVLAKGAKPGETFQFKQPSYETRFPDAAPDPESPLAPYLNRPDGGDRMAADALSAVRQQEAADARAEGRTKQQFNQYDFLPQGRTGMAYATENSMEGIGSERAAVAIQGGTLGWGDELAGAIAGAVARAQGYDFGQQAETTTRAMNRDVTDAYAARPLESLAIEAGTGIATSVGAASRLGAFKGAAASGAVYGAGTANRDGAGLSEGLIEGQTGAEIEDGGLADRAIGAAEGGTIGVATVGALKVAEPFVRAGVRKAEAQASKLSDALSSLVGRQGTAQRTQAEKVARAAVRRSMQRSGLTFDQIMEQVRRFEDKPAVLAEVIGQDAVNALTALTRKPGTTSQKAQSIIEDRVGSFPDRAKTDLETATGIPRGTLDDTLEAQVTARQETATPVYRQLFDDFAQAGSRRLEQLSQSPTLQRHLTQAQRAIEDAAAVRGRAPQTLSRMEYWDLVKRSLDDAINSAEARGEATTRVGESVRDLMALKSAVVDELDTITNGAYAAAREVGGEAPRIREAARAGQRALGARNPAEVQRTVADTNPQDLPALRAGMVDDIATRIDKRQLPPSQFATPDKAGKVRAGLGDEAGETFLSRMAAEAELASMGGRWAPRANSVTGTVLENGEAQLAEGAVSIMQWLSTNTLGKLDILARMMRRSGYTQQQMDAMGDLLLSNPREGLRRLGLDPDAPAGGPPAPRAAPAPPSGPDDGGGTPPPQASPNGFNEIMSNGRRVDPAPVKGNGFTSMMRGDMGAALSGALGGGMVPIPVDEDQDFTEALLTRGAAMAGGAAAAVASRRGMAARGADDVAANTFGGVRARTAPKEALDEASRMSASGAGPRAQFERTGSFVDADGRARFEIDDSAAKLRVPAERLAKGGRGQLQDILDHPALYDAYPELAQTKVVIRTQPKGTLGGYNETTGTLELDPSVMRPGNENEIVSILLHEAQHGVQGVEGFARGGSPSGVMARFDTDAGQAVVAQVEAIEAAAAAANSRGDTRAFMEAQGQLRDLMKQARKVGQFETYKHLLGEAEARLVQTRRAMTGAERAASFPLDDLDVPQAKRTVDAKVSPVMKRSAFQTEDETAEAIEDLIAVGYSRADAEELAAMSNQLFSQ
jgi:hypothetical protein